MDKIVLSAKAKINISLDVLRKRPDGYHDLKTIMHSVAISDEVLLVKQKEGITVSANLKFLPIDERNIAYRAAHMFFERTKIPYGVKIEIYKRIPVGGGLAGGSADAAAVLLGLNELYDTGLSTDELLLIGEKLGADVPFCLTGGTQLSEGIGNILTPLPPLPECSIVIVKPGFSVNTKWVYNQLDLKNIKNHPDTDGIIRALEKGDLFGVTRRMYNVLETVTAKKYGLINKIKNDFLNLGAVGSIMSGSGSSVFGIFQDKEKAEFAEKSFKAEFDHVFLCQNLL